MNMQQIVQKKTMNSLVITNFSGKPNVKKKEKTTLGKNKEINHD